MPSASLAIRFASRTQKNLIFRAFLLSRHKFPVQWPMSLPWLVCSRSGPRWMSVHSYAWFCSLYFACCGTSFARGLDVMFHRDCCIFANFLGLQYDPHVSWSGGRDVEVWHVKLFGVGYCRLLPKPGCWEIGFRPISFQKPILYHKWSP